MTSLVIGLALSTPAQPPLPAFPPGVRQFPQVPPVAVFRPVAVPGPIFVPPVNRGPFPPAVQALTLEQFSRVFVPTPGRHQYWIVHPRTGLPVDVCFTLPNCGRLDRLHVGRTQIEIELDRPDFEVRIDFQHNGTVRVRYDD